jgi:hypothetical protein
MSKKKGKKKVKNGELDFQWKVIVPRKVYDTILHIARCAEPDEIQMLSEVAYGNGIFYVHAVHLIKQVVSGASASFDSNSLVQFVSDHPHPENLRGWVHSHVRMGLFWSGTDEGTIARFVRRGWCLSIVVDISGEGSARARVDLNMENVLQELETNKNLPESFAVLKMLPLRATWDNVPVEIEGLLSEEEKEFLKEEVEEKISSSEEVGMVRTSNNTPSKIVYKLSGGINTEPREVKGNAKRCCGTCIYNTVSELCDKGVDRGPERNVMGCMSYYPAYPVGRA